jgi:hypothetical protein
MQHFAVIAMGRSGSSRLCDILGRHPAIACHQEIFFPKEVQAHLPKTLGLKILDTAFRDADHKSFLDEFLRFNEGWFKNCVWHGFKSMLTRPQIAPSLMICRDKRLRKILLYRENLLASYASDRLGIDTGIWQRFEGVARAPDVHKVEFDRDGFHSYCGQRLVMLLASERALRDSGQDFLKIEYAESLTAEGMSRVWRYLDVPEAADRGIYQRSNTRPILECFSNPKDAEKAVEVLGRLDWLAPLDEARSIGPIMPSQSTNLSTEERGKRV